MEVYMYSFGGKARKRVLRGNVSRRKDNIKMEIRRTEWDGINWINLAQDRDYSFHTV
jgi:hypothetical protein